MIELTIQEIRKKQKFVRFLKENNAYYKFTKYFNKEFKDLYNFFNYKKQMIIHLIFLFNIIQ